MYVHELHLVKDLFNWVRELLCISVHDSYASVGIAADKATHVGQVWSDMSDKE
jgi:hypothetical protein